MIVYKSRDLVQTTVTLPRHLRAFARENGISLSGTLRSVLNAEFEKTRAAAGTNRPDHPHHTPGDGRP